MKISVIHENKDFLVIDKPAGVLSHQTDKETENTVTNFLIENYPEIKKVGEDRKRPGIVHRLDKDTSGLMIIARNNKAFVYFKEQFKKKLIQKKYIALVVGHLKEKEGVIDKPIGRSRKKGFKQTVAPVVPRKEASTSYQVLKEYRDYSLLEVSPKTGRMHQIRVHFASLGHPLAGDKQYGFKRQICPIGLKRHFLHAFYLKFSTINGKIEELSSKLPPDLKYVIRHIQ